LNSSIQFLLQLPGVADSITAVQPAELKGEDTVVTAFVQLAQALLSTPGAQSAETLFKVSVEQKSTRLAPGLSPRRQQDATEWLIPLLAKLRRCRVLGSSVASPVQRAMQFHLVPTIECTACGFIRQQTEQSQTVNFMLGVQLLAHYQGSVTLADVLTDFTSATLVHEFVCPNPRCQNNESVERRQSISGSPRTLLIHLLRFDDQGVKNTIAVAAPLLLIHSALSNVQYRLVAALQHHGDTADSGHYTTVRVDADGSAVLIDDANERSPVDWNAEQTREAIYVLAYERV